MCDRGINALPWGSMDQCLGNGWLYICGNERGFFEEIEWYPMLGMSVDLSPNVGI